MKYIMVVIAGAADQPETDLGEKTPFEIAKIPNLNYFSKIGKIGQVKLTSERLDTSADITFLNSLGYNADKVYTGRGPLEAANLELKLEENEVAFRMNFITEANGVLADPTGGNISTKEARALINYLNKRVASGFVRFYPSSKYRHIAVLKDSHGYEALSARTTSPENIVGEKLDTHFPKGPGEELLKKLMFDAKLLLQDHEINQVRVDLRENPANMIWLWGQGSRPNLPLFKDRFGLSGSVISAVDLVNGIGRLAGLHIVSVPGATGYYDTNYKGKAEYALESLKKHDFVYVHVEATDEAGHNGDWKAKTECCERFDKEVVGTILKVYKNSADVRILVAPDHPTPVGKRTHVHAPVPFIIWGKGIATNGAGEYSETAASKIGLKFKSGEDMVRSLFRQ